MDGNESKTMIDELRKNQDLLMQQHKELQEKMLQQQHDHRKEQQEFIEKMMRLLVVLMNAKTEEKVIREEHKKIKIEGVNYDIQQFVDRGGFGSVYKAKALDGEHANRLVAIKFMPNTTAVQDQIQNEVTFLRATQKIKLNNHPVIEYYGCLISDSGIYIAMELAISDLHTFWVSRVAKAGDTEKFIFGAIIIMYVLRALVFLEKLHIIHGDIKPQNLVIVETETAFCIKLIDFGTVEKLDTKVSQMSVHYGKAHTRFFASPEFLKRDANRRTSRTLHKKSDAWAAGVMFYYLLFDQLPWQDEYEYEAFIDDPHVSDIKVPESGGYQEILGMLLKKDPERRASAEETLLKLKRHPIFASIVEALEKKFYPVDDVCRITVSEEIRQELSRKKPERLERKEKTSFQNVASSATVDPGAIVAKSFSHQRDFQQERPGSEGNEASPRQSPDNRERQPDRASSDYREPPNQYHEKPMCRYGSACYRQNPDHKRRYRH